MICLLVRSDAEGCAPLRTALKAGKVAGPLSPQARITSPPQSHRAPRAPSPPSQLFRLLPCNLCVTGLSKSAYTWTQRTREKHSSAVPQGGQHATANQWYSNRGIDYGLSRGGDSTLQRDRAKDVRAAAAGQSRV